MGQETVIGQGYAVIKVDEPSRGVVRYLRTPKDVLKLTKTGDVPHTVVLARAGTVTFVGPVLPLKPAGIITIEGAPQSHLGILAREFGIPAVMSIELTDSKMDRMGASGVTTEEYIDYVANELNGRKVVIDCADGETGRVLSAE